MLRIALALIVIKSKKCNDIFLEHQHQTRRFSSISKLAIADKYSYLRMSKLLLLEIKLCLKI